MDHNRGTKTCLVGENASLHTHLHSFCDARADNAACRRLHGKSTLEDRGEDSGDLRNMHYDDHEGADQVQNDHERDQLLRKGGNALQTANNDQGDRQENERADREIRNMERMVDVLRHTVDLAHVPDTERSQDAKCGEQDRKDRSDLFAVLLAAQSVAEIVHCAAAPFSQFISAPVKNAEHVLRKVRHHPEKGDQPHPEYCARSSDCDRACNTNDITGADRSRQCGTKGLELGDRLILCVCGDPLVPKDLTDRMGHPVLEMRNLVELCQAGHQYARNS